MGDTKKIKPEAFISSDYANKGKIMFSTAIILLLVLIFMLCFHICAKWRLRRRRHFRPQASSAADTTHQGLDLCILKSIPTFVYTPTKQDPSLECAVCLSAFQNHETGRVLPNCNHSFHVACIDMWFCSHSNCPLCRVPVQPPEKSEVPPEGTVLEARTGDTLSRCEGEEVGSTSTPPKSGELVGIIVEAPPREEGGGRV